MSLSRRKLADQTLSYMGTGGISRENQHAGFQPAYRDTRSGVIYLSCYADGRPAPVHVLDGLPAELVVRRSAEGHVMAVSRQVEAGFVRNGCFYTRAEAARWLQRHDADMADPDLVTV